MRRANDAAMTQADHGTVVLTHARGLHALAAAQSLGRRGLRVYGCDEVPWTALSFSRYVRDTFVHRSTRDERAFIDSLRSELEQRRPADGSPYVLMPTHRETRLLAAHRESLADVIRIAAPPLEAIDRVFPKDRLIRTADALGLPAPRTWVMDAEADADERIAQVDAYPVLTKPASAAGGRGIRRADDADQLRRALREARVEAPGGQRAWLIQEMVGGEDYCFTALFDSGRLAAHMTYRNLRTFPGDGGPGAVRQTVDAQPCRAIAERLMGELEWHGVVQVDFRWTGEADDTPHLIEVNPRFWAGLFQSMESGVDYPWLLYRLMVDGTAPAAPEPTVGTRTKVPGLTLLSVIDELTGDEGHMQAMRREGRAALKQLRDGRFGEGLGAMAEAVGRAVDLDGRWQTLRTALRDGEGAAWELFSSDDPAVSLGVMWVLAYVMKTGELPEEIKRAG